MSARPALVLALALFVATTAIAQAAPTLDTQWESARRTLDISMTSDGFQLQSTGTHEGVEDVLRVTYAGRLAMTRFEYDPGADAPTLDMMVSVDEVVEFRDNDGDGRLGAGDTPVQRFPTRTAGFAVVPIVTVPETFNLRSQYDLNVTRNDGLLGPTTQGGRLSFSFQMIPYAVGPNTPGPAPTALRWSLSIEDFPFNRTDTRVAILTTVTGDEPLEPGAGQFSQSEDLAEATYAWDITDDKRETASSLVESSGDPADAGPRRVTHAFGRDAIVGRDTEFQAHRFTPESIPPLVLPQVPGDGPLYLLGLAAALGVIVPTGLRRLRRKP